MKIECVYLQNLNDIPRKGLFPFRVNMIYFCNSYSDSISHMATPENTFEISLRLDSGDQICRDEINGVQIETTFPNVAWKKPGGRHVLHNNFPRSTFSFSYPVNCIKGLKELDLIPDMDCMPFHLTKEINKLINQIKTQSCNLYSPGMIDMLDWTCFKLIGELRQDCNSSQQENDMETKIKNISMWFKIHYNENFDMEEIIQYNGFSRTSFFRCWRNVFNVSPLQYVLDIKLHTAAELLKTTNLPIGKIMEEINFSGATAFYRRFTEKYGMSPGDFREKAGLWPEDHS